GLALGEGAPLELAARALPAGPCSARFALEAALLDRAGTLEGLPVARLLGATSHRLRSVVLLDSLGSALEDAEVAAASGAPGVKVKIGRPGRAEDEAKALRAIRRALGESS